MDEQTQADPPIIKTTTDARQGQTTGRVRWVLLVSLALAVVALIVTYFVG